MPNIFQQNTNTLMNLSNKVDQDRQNALTMRKAKLDMSNAERHTLMQNLYTVGRSADSVVDEESYQRWKGFIGTTYGQAAADKIPKSYDADGKDYVDQKKAESNILYESLGKGKPVEVPLYRMDGDKRIETKAIYGSPRFKDLISGKRGHKWEQGHLVQSPSKQRTPDEEVDVYKRKKKIDMEYAGGGTGGTEDERQSYLHKMSVPQYKAYLEELKIQTRKKFGWLSAQEHAQVVQYTAEVRRLKRAIDEQEKFLTVPNGKEMFPEKAEKVEQLNDELYGIQEGLNRITGVKKENTQRPSNFPKDLWDNYIKDGKDPDDLIERWNNLKTKPKVKY